MISLRGEFGKRFCQRVNVDADNVTWKIRSRYIGDKFLPLTAGKFVDTKKMVLWK